MSGKYLLFIIILVGLSSCKNFELKKVSSEDLLVKEVNHLDWSAVDVYPTFDACNRVSEAEAMPCFENKVSTHIYSFILKRHLNVSEALTDTIVLSLAISKTGEPSLKTVTISKTLQDELPNIKSLCDSAINTLPKIYPAQKRGVPVASEFKLPLIIKTN